MLPVGRINRAQSASGWFQGTDIKRKVKRFLEVKQNHSYGRLVSISYLIKLRKHDASSLIRYARNH